MSLAQGNNTPTRPRIEPGSPDPESDALTIKPVRSPDWENRKEFGVCSVWSTQGILTLYYMSHVMRKPDFCISENKDADQLRGNRKADQRLCFRYTDSTIPLVPTSEISSL